MKRVAIHIVCLVILLSLAIFAWLSGIPPRRTQQPYRLAVELRAAAIAPRPVAEFECYGSFINKAYRYELELSPAEFEALRNRLGLERCAEPLNVPDPVFPLWWPKRLGRTQQAYACSCPRHGGAKSDHYLAIYDPTDGSCYLDAYYMF